MKRVNNKEMKSNLIIKKVLMIFALILGIMLFKMNTSYAAESAYFTGSRDSIKASEGYIQAKGADGENLEVTLDLTQRLDKMVYYILTYEEYDNKTYKGDSDLLKLKERKQSALYYLIYNYKQNVKEYSQLTNNDKLKSVLQEYTGAGNSLSDFDEFNKNGVQIIYSLADSWARGENLNNAALKLAAYYKNLDQDDLKYWPSYENGIPEGTIYSPSEETTLFLSIYIPKEEKTAQNAIKVEDKEIVEEKVKIVKNLLKGNFLEGNITNECNIKATKLMRSFCVDTTR